MKDWESKALSAVAADLRKAFDARDALFDAQYGDNATPLPIDEYLEKKQDLVSVIMAKAMSALISLEVYAGNSNEEAA